MSHAHTIRIPPPDGPDTIGVCSCGYWRKMSNTPVQEGFRKHKYHGPAVGASKRETLDTLRQAEELIDPRLRSRRAVT